MKFKIKNYEIVTESIVEANGMLEAISDYLPWKYIQLDITYNKHIKKAKVIDRVTDFRYDIEEL